MLASRIRPGRSTNDGFSTLELVVVVSILLVVAAVAIPGYSSITRYLRVSGDARDLNGMIAQAKMRAAEDYTHARVHADLINNTFQLEVWDKGDKGLNGGKGCWITEGDGTYRCTASSSPVQTLSPGVSFGFASVSTGNPNPQSPIAQAPACNSGVAGGTWGSTLSGTTACIEFNSRGLPVAGYGLANSNSPTANDALYITDNNTVFGVTVIISGLIQVWTTPTSSTAWSPR